MTDYDYVRFGEAVKRLAASEAKKVATGVVFGTVVDIDSDGGVTIELLNGYMIGGEQLILSMFCKERTIHIPVDKGEDYDKDSHVHDESEELQDVVLTFAGSGTMTGSGGVSPSSVPNNVVITLKHKHEIKPALPTIKLWRGLIVGDMVSMLELGNGQYYVMERAWLEGDDSNEVLNPEEEGLKSKEE